MIAIAFRRAADRLLVVDPGLARFTTALRATLATLLSALVCIGLAVRYESSPALAGLAVLFSMIAPLFLRDHGLRNWLTSLFILYAVAVFSFAAASALEAFPFVADSVFVAFLFTGMLVQACGPRALGSALIGIVAFYLGIYLHLSLANASLALALSMAAPCATIVVARWIVPPRHAAALRLAIHTVTLRAQSVLQASRSADRAHAALSSMNEAAIAFEDRLSLLDSADASALREALVELEVAAGQYVFDESNRPAREAAFRSAIKTLANMETRFESTRPAVSPGLAVSFARWRANLSWLPATRTAAAAMMAMGAGHLLSSERWFWAVITTFVVFLGTRSRGDTLYRAMQRLSATLAGGLVSTVLVIWLHGEPVAIVTAMLLCVFGWAYFIMSAYGPGVFFITVLVSIVYGELGLAVQPLIELRIGEVAIGCVASLIAAFAIKPLGTTRHVEARFFSVIDALIEGVKVAALSAQDSNSDRGAATVRALDRRWHEFRIALRPQRAFVWEPRDEHIAGALLCCVHHVRAMLGSGVVIHESGFGAVIARLEAIRARYANASTTNATHRAGFVEPCVDGALASLDGAVALLAARMDEPEHGRVFALMRRNPALVAQNRS